MPKLNYVPNSFKVHKIWKKLNGSSNYYIGYVSGYCFQYFMTIFIVKIHIPVLKVKLKSI